jgi:hypothetical protein
MRWSVRVKAAQRIAVGARPHHIGAGEEARDRGFAGLGVDLAILLMLDPGRRLIAMLEHVRPEPELLVSR